MKIAVIGTGYVGLVSGACFADFGHHVTCVDTNDDKIRALQQGVVPIYEPGLADVIQRTVAAGCLHFTTNTAQAVANAQVVLIAVGTPSRRGDGHADVSYVMAAAHDIAMAMQDYTVVVTKSTVPVGTGRQVADLIAQARPDAQFDMASNPEFLREGSAIEDFKRPDRVVIGTDSARARDVLRLLYRPLSLNEVPMVHTGLESAETIKYAANAFLALKITFINEIANLCEQVGANVQDVARGIGSDRRIGSKFLHPGPGFGGSCFPKDTAALARIGRDADSPLRLVETVMQVNAQRKAQMAQKIIQACGGAVQGKKIAIWGLAFKPNTDDMRDAPALDIIPLLQQAGASVWAHDPVVPSVDELLPHVTRVADPYEAARDATILVLLTEWDAYRAIDWPRLRGLLTTPQVVDLRNIYKRAEVEAEGFAYTGVGT